MNRLPATDPASAAAADRPAAAQDGIALVMALMFSILIYILVAELVVSSRMVRATGENDALLARMRTQMYYQLAEAEDKLLQDLAGQAAGEGGGAGVGGLEGALSGAAPAEGGGLPGEEAAADPSSTCDSSRDAWFDPVGHPENDLTTYVWIEDENRKFNILSIWSEDEEYAQRSREGLVRLIDTLRQDTIYDVPSGEAATIVQELLDWGNRPSTEQMPTPLLKSRDEQRRDFVIPLHLDELMMLRSVDEDLFFDKVIDQRVHPGLESVLTLWTSLRTDPGDPEKLAQQRAIRQARGEVLPEENAPPEASPGGTEGEGAEEEQGPPQPEGLGVKVNVNTASRPVLRALFPPDKVPDRIIDAIIRYRNEIDEDATEAAAEEALSTTSEFGDMQLGDKPLRNYFESLADLEEVEEYASIPDEDVKAEFQKLLTTDSEVFSIHLATLYKRNDSERNRVYLLRRARSIVLRVDDGEEGQIVPLVPFEERVGLRVQPVDLQDEEPIDFTERYVDMDQFSQEERAWNPFLIDFYLPQDMRRSFYSYR